MQTDNGSNRTSRNDFQALSSSSSSSSSDHHHIEEDHHQNLNYTSIVIRTESGTCCNRDLRNQPQANAVGAAAMIFLTGGMHIAWSIGFNNIYSEFLITHHLRISWFIAVIIGVVMEYLFSRRFSYKLLMELSCLLVIVGGITTAVTKFKVGAILAASYMNGIANGLAFAPTLHTAGELSVCYKRGSITSGIEQWPTTIGIFVQTVCSVSWDPDSDFTVVQMQGTLAIICGIIGLFVAFKLSIESPVELLAAGDEEGAIDVLAKLQCPRAVTADTYDQMTEHRLYLAHNATMSEMNAWRQSIPALVRLCLMRGLYAASTSMIVVFTVIMTSTSVYGENSGPYVLFGFLRLVGSCSCTFSLDSLGRKIPILMGLIICGGMSIGVASRFTISESLRINDMRTALWLLLIYQLFVGIAFAPTSSYLSEAFPLAVKRPCIGLAYTLEMIIQLAISSTDISVYLKNIANIPAYFFSVGAIQLLGILTFWYMPETKLTTLRLAQEKFRHFAINQRSDNHHA